MAGGQERVLRRRIRSVQATKKITRAMELIAASQMVRAQSRIAGSKPYLDGIERVLIDVAADGTAPERLIDVPESPENVAVVVMVSDRGLCGGYNAFVLRAADRLMRTGEGAGRSYRLVGVGKKAAGYFRFRGRQLDETFAMGDRPSYEDARRIAATVVPAFMVGELDLGQLVSTRFISSGTQVVETRQLLPLVPPSGTPLAGSSAAPESGRRTGVPPSDGGVAATAGAVSEGESATGRSGYFEYEPEPEELLSLLVPRYAEAALYGALLEASASEHVARQRAMSAASENADDLITSLRRVMNRARQDAITTEIMEIVGGAEALRQGAHRESAPPRPDIDAEEQIA
ncbi:MAG TPA: ATP synthase F1 subunit gamma [Acidimicrobiales bacterium]|nr:ATP synthase F1 subunit gamma [Acidimicrobiales bacterium]